VIKKLNLSRNLPLSAPNAQALDVSALDAQAGDAQALDADDSSIPPENKSTSEPDLMEIDEEVITDKSQGRDLDFATCQLSETQLFNQNKFNGLVRLNLPKETSELLASH
jgi:hypothetical protein